MIHCRCTPFHRRYGFWLLPLLFCWAVASTPTSSQILSAGQPNGFVANKGQWPPAARFVATTRDQMVACERDGVVLQQWAVRPDGIGAGWMVRLKFEGARSDTCIRGEQRLAGDSHFFLGDDPSSWRRHVPRYAAVVYEGLYDGVDLRLDWGAKGIEYQLHLQPGARVEDISVRCDGAIGPSAGDSGEMMLETGLGELRPCKPAAWEQLPSESRRGLGCKYRLVGPKGFGFSVDGWGGDTRLTISLGLDWATYLGGANGEGTFGRLVAGVGPGSAVTIAGSTSSPEFPTSPGAYDVVSNGTDVFVTRLTADGSALQFSTFLGGGGGEWPSAIHVDPSGSTVIVGATNSKGFPTTPDAFDSTKNGIQNATDGFITKLAPDGSDLVFSTFLGGNGFTNEIDTVAVASDGSFVVAGLTNSIDFPITADAFDPTHAGTGLNDFDAFVSRLDASLSRLEFSTYLGGSAIEFQLALALLDDGRPVVGGTTKSVDFPYTTEAFKSSPDDMFVAILSADGTQLQSATSLGGSHNQERLWGVAVSPWGDIVVAGHTLSSDFPTTPDAFQPVDLGGSGDNGFVSIFDSTLSTLEHSTYLWGGASVDIHTLLIDSLGAPIVGGVSWGVFFPTTPGAFKEALPFGDINDVFVTRFSPDLQELWYSTYVGGSGWEDVGPGNPGLALDVDGAVVATFATTSTDFPTGPDAVQPSFAGATDALVARLNLLPAGVGKYGASTPGAQGPLAAGVTAMPSVGAIDFALTCGHAPASSVGWLGIALGPLATPLSVGGAGMWIDPSSMLGLLPVASNDIGACIRPLRLPDSPAAVGLQAYVQFFWKVAAGPLSASNALSITIQP